MREAITITLLFTTAWAVSRISALVARRGLEWHDRRHHVPRGEPRAKIIELKRRETTVAVIRTGIAYVAVAAAVVLSVAQLSGGFDRLTTFAGASFLLILAGFAIQRLLIDIIAGFSMWIERWYSVGDTIVIPTLEIQGVVEDVSLRRTKLRTLDGEVINVHNSQVPAVRVLPGGLKELDVELVASDRAGAESLVADVGTLVPEGPTTFVHRPRVQQIEELAPSLVRVRMRAAVVPGREWLVDGFYTDLLKERAAPGVIVHGPVVLAVDESATRSFARASAATRWAAARG
jgi:small conductance mechanosensitive channel